MTDRDFEDALEELLDAIANTARSDEHEDAFEQEIPPALWDVDRVETFEAAGVLTNNRGLVVKLADGREFQLTIVQSLHHGGFTDDRNRSTERK